MPKKYTGINIQFPISTAIVSGEKTIETRTYKLPEKYLNTEMLLIETPGKSGNFISRITAIIKFTDCIEYESKEQFYTDSKLHLVTPDSLWAWKEKKKYGWKVEVIKTFPNPITYTKKKGILYTLNIEI